MTATFQPHHHPDADLLLRYTAGRLSAPMHFLMDVHLSLCPSCRAALQECEGAAGLALENLPPEEMDTGCLDHLLSRIESPAQIQCIDVTIPIKTSHIDEHRIPDLLVKYTGQTGEKISWDHKQGYALWAMPLTASCLNIVCNKKAPAHLFKIDANTTLATALLDKNASVVIIHGSMSAFKTSYHTGDVVKAETLLALNARTNQSVLILVVTPQKGDVPGLFERVISLICGDVT